MGSICSEQLFPTREREFMASNGMLQSRILKRALVGIFATCVSCASQAVIKIGTAEAFLTSEVTISAEKQQQLYVAAELEKELLVVFEGQRFEEAVNTLSAESGITLRVDASRSERIISLVSDQEPTKSVLRKLSESTQSFLVYRNNYLLFTDSANIQLELSRPMEHSEISELSKRLSGIKSTVHVSNTHLDGKVSREAYSVIRAFIVDAKIAAKLTSSDLVIDRL